MKKVKLCGEEYEVVQDRGKLVFAGPRRFEIATRNVDAEISVKKVIPRSKYAKYFLVELKSPFILLTESGTSFFIDFPFDEEIVVDETPVYIVACENVKLTLVPILKSIGGYLSAKENGNVKIVVRNHSSRPVEMHGLILFSKIIGSENSVVVIDVYRNSIKVWNKKGGESIILPRKFLLESPVETLL